MAKNDLAVIGKSDVGNVTLNPHSLVTSRLLVTANSGGGKSYLLRKLIEQIGKTAQTFVLDLEGEFASLREQLDLVIVGPGGEVPADVRSAGLLVRRLMEKGISAVIDLSELKFHQRRTFVRVFLEALMELPKPLWHPLFVVIDEAHQFAPEKGHGEAESLQAVRDLCTLGRKRGFCAILATQRISTLDKSCAGECNNKFIGRMTLDLDVKRAAFELGVSAAEALKMLRDLNRGQFHAFGPAIDPPGVTRLTVGKVLTTHPKAGQGQTLTPPKPSAAITSIVGELADLPKQAEAEIKDMAAARTKIAELTRQLAAKPAPAAAVEKVVEKPVITDKQIERLEKLQESIAKRVDAWWTRASDGVNPLIELLKSQSRETATLLATAQAIRKVPTLAAALPAALPAHTSRVVIETRRPVAPPRPASTAARPSDGTVSPAMQKILDSLAWWEVIGQPAPQRGAAAVMAGYTVNGHFNNLCGALRTAGLIDYPAGGAVAMTEAGRAAANFPGAPGTLAEVHDAWKKKLDNAQWKLVDVVIRSHPNALEKEELAAAAGYTVNGHFNNLLGSLRSLGVIHKRSPIAATTLLFPEGLA